LGRAPKVDREEAVPIDAIGYWSEIKLDIIREYAQAYATILAKQKNMTFAYVDGFAGAGVHLDTAGDWVLGSPLNALNVRPPFHDYYLIDLDDRRVSMLKKLTAEYSNVHLFGGDCNKVLMEEVFPQVKYENYRRALCLLDPYGLHLNWEVVARAGAMRSIELFVNFPLMDMNMNVLWHNPSRVDPKQAARMTAYWGDDSWRRVAYTGEWNLFGFPEKEGNQVIARAYQERLKNVAGFAYVPDPLPMRNSKGAEVYYLFFASQKPVAQKIVREIFVKYHERGLREN
jgi:three-Cys-motif partner protein